MVSHVSPVQDRSNCGNSFSNSLPTSLVKVSSHGPATDGSSNWLILMRWVSCIFMKDLFRRYFIISCSFINRSQDVGEFGKINQKWTTRSLAEDYVIITTKILSTRRQENVMCTDLYVIFNHCLGKFWDLRAKDYELYFISPLFLFNNCLDFRLKKFIRWLI